MPTAIEPNEPIRRHARRATSCLPLLALALALALSGCSGPDGGKVTGTVRLDGKPLADASVHLWPKDDLEAGVYWGKTNQDGRFELTGRNSILLKPGSYIVLIARDVKKDGTPPRADDDWQKLAVPGALRNTLPPRYSDKSRPVFTVEVKKGDNELPPFELTSQDERDKTGTPARP